MPAPPLLLQTAEIAQVATDAAGAVTHHAAENAFTALLWLLIVVLVGITAWQWRKTAAVEASKLQLVESQQATLRTTLTDARADWAQEMAIDNGNAAALQRQMREQYERQIKDLSEANEKAQQRLEKINTELRLQEGKSVEVLGATGNKMREIANALTQVANNQTEMIHRLNVLAGSSPPLRPLPFSTTDL